MNCPACQRKLTPVKIGPVVLDACQNGCGGVWFDAAELSTVNAALPSGKPVLTEITCDETVQPDEHHERKCVRCADTKLERKLFSLGTGVILDRCPKCDGIWLDHGELETIREETHPTPRPARQVVKRAAPPKSIPISFQVVQQVQKLRIQK